MDRCSGISPLPRWAAGFILCGLGLIGIASTSDRVSAAEGQFTLNSRDVWANVFAGKATKFHFTVVPKPPAGSNVVWILSSQDERTLAHGRVPLEVDAAEQTNVELQVDMPPVKSGVVLSVQLQVGLQLESKSAADATYERQLLIFPADPFVDRSQWLKDLKIGLFDPSGSTAALFEKAKIPFRLLMEAPRVGDEFASLLIIGEKISLRDNPDLIEEAARLSARGVAVLCLAPADGQLAIPGLPAGSGRTPVSLTFAGTEVIHQLDKRLDADGWPTDGRIAGRRLRLVADEGRVLGQVGAESGGWVWMEAAFPETGGRLVICQFDLVEKWESSPAPRFLFARILETLTGPTVNQTRERNERP